jgi:hypothetical protein
MIRGFLFFLLAASAAAGVATESPNIVFLVVESTDGRTWRRGYQNNVFNDTNLKNLRTLEDLGGTSFHTHYSNTPV